MNIIDVWLDVSKRIYFFTKETCEQIPEKPGIYAWFIPLWLYKEDILELLDVLNEILLYDSECKGVPEKTVDVQFNWSPIKVSLTKTYATSIGEELKQKWNEAMSNKESKEALEQTLMEASIFMPPLYVGKTKNLRDRYLQHVNGSPYIKNEFHTRFTEFANKKTERLPIKISDLLFACILTDSRSSKYLNSEDINTFIERILLNLCKPIFSRR